ncbi:MAG: hypothetical protein M1812_004648 [Candelaria pacifica]|nr:MAG: hypothetical protein M1812_004648 [Candelaria pacifica]
MNPIRKSKRIATRDDPNTAEEDQPVYLVFEGERLETKSEEAVLRPPLTTPRTMKRTIMSARPVLIRRSPDPSATNRGRGPQREHPFLLRIAEHISHIVKLIPRSRKAAPHASSDRLLHQRNPHSTFQETRFTISRDTTTPRGPTTITLTGTQGHTTAPSTKRAKLDQSQNAIDLEQAKVFGDIPNMPVETTFHDSLVHRDVVLSGGYPDDFDNGYDFLYSGQGGRTYGNQRTGSPISDQVPDKGNAALVFSCQTVAQSESFVAPMVKRFGLRSLGTVMMLYFVDKVWEMKSGENTDSHHVYKFRSERMADQADLDRETRPGSWSHDEVAAMRAN